jgi:hypothetical protein
VCGEAVAADRAGSGTGYRAAAVVISKNRLLSFFDIDLLSGAAVYYRRARYYDQLLYTSGFVSNLIIIGYKGFR